MQLFAETYCFFFFVAGLFAYSHMDFDVDRNTNDTGDPSLAEMTIKALRILSNNPEGYFLFVEGKSEVRTLEKEPLASLCVGERSKDTSSLARGDINTKIRIGTLLGETGLGILVTISRTIDTIVP